MSTMTVDNRATEIAGSDRLPVLVSVTRNTLLALIVSWLAFQILAIRAPFPPIGTLYSVAYGVSVFALSKRKGWGLPLAVGVTALVQLVESPLTLDHLLHWGDIYTHFDHYLLIGAVLPLSILAIVTGIAAMRRNVQDAGDISPSWLRAAVIATAISIAMLEVIVIALHELQIP